MSAQRTGQDENNTNNKGEGNTINDPDDWTTGGEKMTGAQRSY